MKNPVAKIWCDTLLASTCYRG